MSKYITKVGSIVGLVLLVLLAVTLLVMSLWKFILHDTLGVPMIGYAGGVSLSFTIVGTVCLVLGSILTLREKK